jgi:putative ABC transport system substrate-binding protein
MTVDMRRRTFVKFAATAAFGWPLAALAQRDTTVRRIGVLMPFSADDSEIKDELAAFLQQLQRLGWTDGGNLRIDYRWASDRQNLQADADELIGLQPDVLFTRSTPATAAFLKKTRTIPVVFAVVSDPVGEGFVTSLARPGGNATGFTNAEASLTGKWLALLKEIAPAMNRLGFMFDPKTAPGGGAYYTGLVKTAAASSVVVPTAMPVNTVDEIERAIDDFAREPDGGLLVLPDATTNRHRASIIALANRHRLPSIYAFHNLAEEGGLLSYGVDVAELFRHSAIYVDRILKGTSPADLPVQLPEKFELVINLRTAKALGLTVSNQLQLLADKVIE